MKIRIGTRGSHLALWQAYFVRDRLQAAGAETEIVTVETKGDKILDVSISKIGSKGVFTEEIEQLLSEGKIDIAVHSAKDMQSTLPNGFELIAFAEREKANDVLLSRNVSLSMKTGGFRIGTSSTRRIAMIKHLYPQIQVVSMRGNLQTRIAKMDKGDCDALLLAYAGVHRMGYDDMIAEMIPKDVFTPAVGQGSIAIEVHTSLGTDKKLLVRDAINHKETEVCLKAERAFLKEMDGGCSIPVFGLAALNDEGLELTGGIISLDGQTRVDKVFKGSQEDPDELGQKLALAILTEGGKEILDKIKAETE